MRLTLSVIKADVGSVGGHTKPSARMMAAVEGEVAKAIGELRARGITEVSLNFAAFARVLHSPRGRGERLLKQGLGWANAFFQIESLYRFNAKFFPRWEPRYLMYEGTLNLPRIALATLWIEGQLPKPSVLKTSKQRDASARENSALGDGG